MPVLDFLCQTVEADDPAAHDPHNWLADTLVGAQTQSGVRVSPEAAMRVAAYFACLRDISEDVAKLPLPVYRRNADGSRTQVIHPVTRLLNVEPNPDMTAMALRETLTHHALGWGGGFAEITLDGAGEPNGLYPIHASRVQIRRGTDKRLYYDVRVDDLGGNILTLPARKVLHLHGLSADGVRGYILSVLARETTGVATAAEAFGARFFKNDARPGGLLRHPGEMNDEAWAEFRTQWIAAHATTAQHTVALLENGMEWQPTSVPPEEAQFLLTREHSVEEICRWFRMPPHKAQHLKRSTFSNIESQNKEYVTDTLSPWSRRWEQECDRKLLPGTGLYVEHNFHALLRGDTKTQGDWYKALVTHGIMSRNEIRELENRGRVPGGELMMVPSNMAIVQEDGSLQPASGKAPAGGGARPQAAQLRPLLVDAVSRLVSKDVKAVSRKAKTLSGKPEQLVDWLAGYAQEQRTYYVGTAGLVVDALAQVGGIDQDRAAEVLHAAAESYAEQLETDVVTAVDAGEVDAWAEAWETLGPERLTRSLMGDLFTGGEAD